MLGGLRGAVMHYMEPHLVALAEVALNFGKVNRITLHPDGVTPESDTDHTVMLGLVACALAARMPYSLNLGLVAQYSLVHDLVEVYAGDTNTLVMPTLEAARKKAYREELALRKLNREFGTAFPWLIETITRYEALEDAEAAFVKAVDKILPKLTHLLNGAATLRKQGLTAAQVNARYAVQAGQMSYAAPYPELLGLRAALVRQVLRLV